jgi:hypothetical protein
MYIYRSCIGLKVKIRGIHTYLQLVFVIDPAVFLERIIQAPTMSGMSDLCASGTKRIIISECIPGFDHTRDGIYQGAIMKEYNKRSRPSGGQKHRVKCNKMIIVVSSGQRKLTKETRAGYPCTSVMMRNLKLSACPLHACRKPLQVKVIWCSPIHVEKNLCMTDPQSEGADIEKEYIQHLQSRLWQALLKLNKARKGSLCRTGTAGSSPAVNDFEPNLISMPKSGIVIKYHCAVPFTWVSIPW